MNNGTYTDSIDFLRYFFGNAPGVIEMRALPNPGVGVGGDIRKAIRFLPETGSALIDAAIGFCKQHDNLGMGVFFGCCTRLDAGGGGGRRNLRSLTSYWLDIDTYKLGITQGEAIQALEGCRLPPSLIVASGGGIHAYWLLTEPVDVTWTEGGEAEGDTVKVRHDAVMKHLARIFRGDNSVAEIAHIMRVAGTHNSKVNDKSNPGGVRVPVKIVGGAGVDGEPVRYDTADVEAWAASQEELLTGAPAAAENRPRLATSAAPPRGVALDPDNPFADLAPAITVDVETELAMMHPGDLHEVLTRVAGSLVSRKWSTEDIFNRLIGELQRVLALHRMPWKQEFEAARMRERITSARVKWNVPEPAVVAGNVVPMRKPTTQEEEKPKADQPVSAATIDFLGYPLNDIGNSARMWTEAAPNIRYVINRGWFIWDSKRFLYDEDGIGARKKAHETYASMKRAVMALPDQTEADRKRAAIIFKFTQATGLKRGLDGMLSELRPYLRTKFEEMDADPMLLNVRNGIVDLKTGKLMPHDRALLMSKLAGANYDPAAQCPRFERFMLEIFDGDAEMVGFVQRALGYSLSGDTREETVFILQGGGANGKTVLVEVMSMIMGDYVTPSRAETWAVSDYPGQSNDLAALKGARFVPVAETERGHQLAEGRIKQATGRDRITARFLYQELFSYLPQFKLWFATNHKPRIKGSDYAIWRRICLIPFDVRFVDPVDAIGDTTKNVMDLELFTKLKAERAGILAWMVRGCLDWQTGGLRRPASVREATKAYREAEDNISSFIAERCNARRSLSDQFGLLYAGYLNWCEEGDEEARSKKEFGVNLSERGYVSHKNNGKTYRKGLDLKEVFRDAAKVKQEDEANTIQTGKTS